MSPCSFVVTESEMGLFAVAVATEKSLGRFPYLYVADAIFLTNDEA